MLMVQFNYDNYDCYDDDSNGYDDMMIVYVK